MRYVASAVSDRRQPERPCGGQRGRLPSSAPEEYRPLSFAIFEFVRRDPNDLQQTEEVRVMREAGENPARPPPLSPGTSRATKPLNARDRCQAPVTRSGRSPAAKDPEARRPAGRNAFSVGEPERARLRIRAGARTFVPDPGLSSRRTGGSNDDRGAPRSARRPFPASSPSPELRRHWARSRSTPAPVCRGGSPSRVPSPRWRSPMRSSISARAARADPRSRRGLRIALPPIVLAGPARSRGRRVCVLLRALAPPRRSSFLATNFANWLQFDTYPHTPSGLALCYAAAVPWFWNTLMADLARHHRPLRSSTPSRRPAGTRRRRRSSPCFAGGEACRRSAQQRRRSVAERSSSPPPPPRRSCGSAPRRP